LTDQVKQVIREAGDELGLTVAQVDVLRQLNALGATPMSRLAEILNCEASNLTGLVDRLELRGLVERQADPTDRRVRLLALTAEGEKASQDAWLAVTTRSPFAKLSDDQRRLLEGLLEKAL
jgi:DNA-binding MarR family transcriptional regulator